MNTCLESLPQRPHRPVRIRSQPGAGSSGAGICRSRIGASGPTKARLEKAERSFVAARREKLFV